MAKWRKLCWLESKVEERRKMKKLIALFLVLLSLMTVLFTGCSVIFRVAGTGEIVEKTYDFTDFTNVEISDAFQYDIKQSDSYSVVVSIHENLVDHLDIHQSGNTLFVGLKLSPFNSADTSITITMPQLNKLVVFGACEGNVTGFDSNGDLETNVSGASKLNMNFKAGKTKLDISGAARITGDLTSTDTQIKLSGSSNLNMAMKTGKTGIDVSGSSKITGYLQALDSQFMLSGASKCELTGSAGNTLIEASGSSKVNSPGLTLQSADVKLAGASYASIHTDETLSIDLSGASTLDYTGNPTIDKIDISGASKVNHK
jgi:hypothetical protein